jgi:hypothetical protein
VALRVFVDEATAGHVHTIQKLTNILVADEGGGMDVGANLGNILDVNTREDQLILHRGLLHLNTLGHIDVSVSQLSQKVLDDDLAVLLFDVDGEVGVDETHLVQEALGDTDAHVLDVRKDWRCGHKK